MLRSVTNELHKLIPLTNDNNQIHVMLASIRKRNRNIFEILARGIANFYSEFFRNQHSWLSQTVLGNEEFVEICHFGFRYLLMMMRID